MRCISDLNICHELLFQDSKNQIVYPIHPLPDLNRKGEYLRGHVPYIIFLHQEIVFGMRGYWYSMKTVLESQCHALLQQLNVSTNSHTSQNPDLLYLFFLDRTNQIDFLQQMLI